MRAVDFQSVAGEEIYGAGRRASTLAKAIKKVRYSGLDLTHLMCKLGFANVRLRLKAPRRPHPTAGRSSTVRSYEAIMTTFWGTQSITDAARARLRSREGSA
jgi:hypothetical protein